MQKTINILGTDHPVHAWEHDSSIEIYSCAKLFIDDEEVWASELFNYLNINDKIIHIGESYEIIGYEIMFQSIVLKLKNRYTPLGKTLHPTHLDRDTLIKNKRLSNINNII